MSAGNELSEEFRDVIYEFEDVLGDEPHAYTGSTNLYLRGVTDDHPNDIDILTTQDGLDAAIDELDHYLEKRYSDRYPKARLRYTPFDGKYNKAVFRTVDQGFVSRLIDGEKGIKIDVFGEVEILEDDTAFNLIHEFDPEPHDLDGRTIPTLPLADEERLYTYLGATDQADQIRAYRDEHE